MKKIADKLKSIKELGFLKSERNHNTGVGKTFEDHFGISENNYKSPDFDGNEVKATRKKSTCAVTLFTKAPCSTVGNRYLLDNYGVIDDSTSHKKLHVSIFGNKLSSYKDQFQFTLKVDRQKEKLTIVIFDMNGKEIDSNVYWNFSDIKDARNLKLNTMLYVKADTINKDGNEYFNYSDASVFQNLHSFENFLDMLEDGKIFFDLRMGTYRSGKNVGKPHDHGSAIRVKKNYLAEMYLTENKC